jgi:subfamily B ATP-binding cassette protein MsbA
MLAVTLCIPIGALDAVIALSLKPYTDSVMIEKSTQAAWYIPFAIVSFAIIQGILNYFATYLNTWVGGKITNDLKFKLYRKLLTFETAFFDKNCSGDVVFRFNADADAASSGLLVKLKMVVSRFFSSISLIITLIYNSWQLSVIAVVILGMIFIPITRVRAKVEETVSKFTAAASSIVTVYNESYTGNKTISSYNLAPHQENKLSSILKLMFRLNIKMTQRSSWLSPLMHIIVSIGIGLSIAYGSYLITTDQITNGNFVSFITALIMLYSPIKGLSGNVKDFQMTLMAIERVLKILGSETKIKNRVGAIELQGVNSGIEFKNVKFGYVSRKQILNNFSCKIQKGEKIAFVGKSGGGKTTVVNLLPRFYDVISGSIKIDGVDIRNYTLESLRNNISVVFQDNFLFSGTIRENILLGKHDAIEEEIEKALQIACLEEFIKSLKNGLDTQIGERGILLSGGQKQRIAIARAFIKNAPIIILDEATSALDNKSEETVQKAIDNLMVDKTVIFIAHRLSTIKNADRIVVIDDGCAVEIGTHEELMAIKNGLYKSLYKIHLKNGKKSLSYQHQMVNIKDSKKANEPVFENFSHL